MISSIRTAFPLLKKELTEQAARKQTYIIRIVYGILFYGVLLFSWEKYTSGGLHYALGQGRNLLEMIFLLQFIGIFLLLPVMTSGAITSEKERNSLQLLMISRLKWWEILFEKLVGRLVPMFTFVLMAIPPVALAYSLGGVEEVYVVYGVTMLFLCMLQVASLSIMCSTFYQTTAGATVATYILGFAFYGSFPLFCGLVGEYRDRIMLMFFPPGIFFEDRVNNYGEIVENAIPTVVTTAIFLFFAYYFLRRRAFHRSRKTFFNLLKKLDNLFFGYKKIYKGRGSLPTEKDPIAWRELSKKSLGPMQYVVIGIVLILFALFFSYIIQNNRYGLLSSISDFLSIGYFTCFIIAVLLITTKGANLIAAERSHQTLDVLLTTPVSSQQILLQKMASLNRLSWSFLFPLLVIVALKTVFHWTLLDAYSSYYSYQRYHHFIAYLLGTTALVLLYIPMLKWIMVWIGLRIRMGSKVILIALATLVAWSIIPWLIFAIIETNGGRNSVYITIAWFSPITPLLYMDMPNFMPSRYRGISAVLFFLTTGGYMMILRYFKNLCLNRCEEYLGRAPERKHPLKLRDQTP